MKVSDVRTFPSHYHLPCSTMAKEWRSREWERRNLAEMDISMLPGRSSGPQQGRGKHWIGWIWDVVETWLTWPCETQSDRMYGMVARWCRKWRCSGVGEDSHWRRMEPVHICVYDGLIICVPQKFHMIKSWFPWLWHPKVAPLWGDGVMRMEPPQWDECFYV